MVFTSAITRLTTDVSFGLMSDLVNMQTCNIVWSYMTLNVLLRSGVVKPHKTEDLGCISCETAL